MRSVVIVLALLAALAAPAQAAAGEPRSGSAPLQTPCGDGSATVRATWWFPAGRPHGLLWLQHGFARGPARVADLARAIARGGALVVAPALPSFDARCGINATRGHLDRFPELLAPRDTALLSSARAASAAAGVRPPRRLPRAVALAGHSAGGAAMTFVGGRIAASAPAIAGRLRGVLLLDPVESFARAMAAGLPPLIASGTPVRTISAPPSSCNAGQSGTKRLADAATGFAGVVLTRGSHVDAEGASTDVLGPLACGRSSPEAVAALQRLATSWLGGWLTGRPDPGAEPGGALLESLLASGAATAVVGRSSSAL